MYMFIYIYTEKDSLPYQNKFLRRCKSFYEYLAHFNFKTCNFNCNVTCSRSHKILFRIRFPHLFLYLSFILKLSFPDFSTVSLTFSLYFFSSRFYAHSRCSRCFTLTHILSLWNFSLSNTELPKMRTSPYRKWLFPSSTKPFRNSNGVTLYAILWDKCLTWRIIKREAGSNQTAESKSRILRRSFLLSRRGHRRASFISHRSSLTIITIVVRLNIMTRRNSHSGASTMRRSDWSAMLVPSNSSRLRVDDDVDLSTIEFVITMVDVKLSLD